MLKNQIRSQKGISTIELIPVLLLFAMLFNFSLGFFGVIHSGILNSIAARNYAFETFRNRANLTYLRDISPLQPDIAEARYTKKNFRFHAIISESHGTVKDDWIVTRRPLKFTEITAGSQTTTTVDDHNIVRQIADNGKASDVFTGKGPDDSKNGISPVWLKTIYGICLTSTCKPSN